MYADFIFATVIYSFRTPVGKVWGIVQNAQPARLVTQMSVTDFQQQLLKQLHLPIKP